MSETLPFLDETNRAFWTSGADGALRMQRCSQCGHWLHPPSAACPACGGRSLAFQPLSGRATVAAVTLNHQPWAPGMHVPYAIVIVELDEQRGLRLTSNVRGVAPEQVHIGMRVQVAFEAREDVWIPLFEPLVEPP